MKKLMSMKLSIILSLALILVVPMLANAVILNYRTIVSSKLVSVRPDYSKLNLLSNTVFWNVKYKFSSALQADYLALKKQEPGTKFAVELTVDLYYPESNNYFTAYQTDFTEEKGFSGLLNLIKPGADCSGRYRIHAILSKFLPDGSWNGIISSQTLTEINSGEVVTGAGTVHEYLIKNQLNR